MMMSDEDTRALRQAIARVKTLGEACRQAEDTEAICRALWAVRGAAIDAYALVKIIEDNTRNAALREVETRLELLVGMEAMERL